MSEKREYAIVDCLTSIDIRKNAVVPGARTRVGGSHDGKQDLGHICKSIFEYDNFGFLWVIQEAGVSSPYGNCVSHSNADELEFVVSGYCNFKCPDGFNRDLVPGDCFILRNSMPHKNTHDTLENLNLLVFYPRRIAEIDRVEYLGGNTYSGDGKCEVLNCYSTPATEVEPGYFRLNVFDSRVTSMAYQYLKPSACIPATDFMAKDADEIIYILDGGGIATYTDKTYRLRPHLAIHNPPGTAYRLQNDTDADLKMLVFYAAGKAADVKTSLVTY